MALKEQDIVFTTTDEAGNPVIQFPITRVENVEDAVRTVNKKKLTAMATFRSMST